MKFIKKVCSRLNILRMMKHNLDRNSLEKLYFGFIRPILEYGKFQDVLNLDILLKGSPILTVDENTEIFDAVHHFITSSYIYISLFS